MTLLFVKIVPPSTMSLPAVANAVVQYEREIPSETLQPSRSTTSTIDHAPAERILALPPSLDRQFALEDYFAEASVGVRIVSGQGVTLAKLEPEVPSTSVTDGGGKTYLLTWTLKEQEVNDIVKGLTPLVPTSTRMLRRRGQFVAVGRGPTPEFREYTLLVGALRSTDAPGQTLKALFGTEDFRTTSRRLELQQLDDLGTLQLGEMQSPPLTVPGRFEFALSMAGDENGWLWLLIGPVLFAGLQAERSLDGMRSVTILLPFPASAGSNGFHPNGSAAGNADVPSNGTRPLDATEDELLSTPELFNDDPGTYCKPFANPNRVVGERTFHTVLRISQPEIGGDASVPPPDHLSPFPFSPDLIRGEIALVRTADGGGETPRTRTVTPIGLTGLMAAASSATDATTGLVTTRDAIAQRRRYVLEHSVGRRMLSSKTMVDWEGDSSIYQATSLAFGHILEFRVSWRSNGYSLGEVAHTLTLAPRQSRRILTAESRIVDRVMRREVTQSTAAVSQGTLHDVSYTDAVRSNLTEWAKGGSEASTSGASLGLGFAMKGFVLGGGAAHGSSSSTSWQNGGRAVAAREEQSLRDAIRQYGESLRKLESMVVVEQSQVEFVQATSEVVRNPNYCHSLTVIYHEILRHMRVDTRVVGARECVFVPLTMQPFTAERALRWRDVLERCLLKTELRWVMRYLGEVVTNFASGDFPSGARADQPVHYISGTIYLQLAVERPKDGDDDSFVELNWNPLISYSGFPVRQIYARLVAEAASRRDAAFQRDNAPTIAANWVNSLRLSTPAGPLDGVDFTLASKYLYNQTLRVDFTCTPPANITRRNLVDLMIDASSALSSGSVANVKKVEIHYYTDTFDRREISPSQTDDLITVPGGEPEATGARVHLALSQWERQDMRAILLGAVQDLVTHLNEHVELYLKHIWWSELDRDKLLMLLDSIYALGPEDGRSVASVVEREPIGIMGNCLVYPVGAGAFLGVDGHTSQDELNRYYRDTMAASEPIRVSLPTSGLYAQAIMDECNACEEHEGSQEWVLADNEPELADLGIDALASRRALLPDAAPSQLPASFINIQNAPPAPLPTGLGGALDAVTNANAFRDMTGLAGNQTNARASMEAAANLAAQFAAQAVELRKAEMGTELAKKKMDAVAKAQEKDLVDHAEAQRQTKKILDQMNVNEPSQRDRLTQEPDVSRAIRNGQEVKINRTMTDGTSESVEVKSTDAGIPGKDGTEGSPGEGFDPFAPTEGKPGLRLWDDEGHTQIGTDEQFATREALQPLLTFNSPEHAELGQNAQRMIDFWALNALIEGGAFIDTGSHKTPDGRDTPIDDWKIVTPTGQTNSAGELEPYAALGPLSHAHWYYIAPNPYGPGTGQDWTSTTLKAALKSGEAVALSIGQILMLAGDEFETFEELVGSGPTGSAPRKAVNLMEGFDSQEPWAYVLLSLKAFPEFPFSNDQLAALSLMEKTSTSYAEIEKIIRSGSADRFTNTENLVQFLRDARGPTVFSEAHVLARILSSNKPLSRRAVALQAPWLSTSAKTRALSDTNNMNDDAFNIGLSNGHYLELAGNNEPHFNPLNWDTFERFQRDAFTAIQTHMTNPTSSSHVCPIPAEAVARAAFGLHFLTDAFASGHMRIPRQALGAAGLIAAKIMHDLDNRYGLLVQNGFNEIWRAYGDGYLTPGDPPTNPDQRNIVELMRKDSNVAAAGIKVDPMANYHAVESAVGSALKQLHYEAQRLGKLNPSSQFKTALDQNRGTDPGNLMWDALAPGDAFLPGSSVDDKIDASISVKLSYMRQHQPQTLAAGTNPSDLILNHAPLFVDQNGAAVIPGNAPYTWVRHMSKLNKDRILRMKWHGLSVDYDFSDFFHLERTLAGHPPQWLGVTPSQVLRLVQDLAED